MKKFKILSREKILDNQWVPMEKQIVEFPNGNTGEWFVHTGGDAVVVVPVMKDGQILLQKNYKHGCGKNIIEFCAGMVDEGEVLEIAAERELLEETGYQARKMIKIGEVFSNPTSSIMRHIFFVALDCKKVAAPQLEDAEQVEPFLVKNLTEAERVLYAEKTSSATLSALGFYRWWKYKK